MSGNGSHNGKVAPAAFPPPVDSQKEFIKRGLDAEDELIEVGVAIVGGGTAGLSCANRLLQLLADDPETMERLGEVPVAVVEKAKTCGGHNLSGAVMRPGPLQELFPELSREDWRKEGFAYGEVKKEAVYLTPTSKLSLRIPTPPPFKNHGNEVVSVSAMARYQQQPGRRGRRLHPHRDRCHAADRRRRPAPRVVGVRSGDKGRGKDGEPLGNFEPGTDIKAHATVLAEGCWGHLTGAAIKEFDLGEGREPQVWELGVKEIWKVPKPLDRLIHTMGPWPLKISPKYGQVGGTWIYPMKNEKTGEDLVSIGFVVELEYADATTSAHDLLQTFKTHPLVRGILEGGERVALGRQGAARRRLLVDAQAVHARRACWSATPAGWSTRWRSRACTTASCPAYSRPSRSTRRSSAARAASSPTSRSIEESSVGKELWEVRNARQPLQKGLLIGGPLSGIQQITKGKLPGRASWHRNDEKPMFIGNTKDVYPKPDGKYTFDKLSSVFITGNATRDDAPNHIRVRKHVPREIAETWRWMCPAGVYEIPEDAPEHGEVDVIVNYTNCVQCGAITAKGGRLTTPEGGDGPLYQIT